jgi:hypothetical protein
MYRLWPKIRDLLGDQELWRMGYPLTAYEMHGV